MLQSRQQLGNQSQMLFEFQAVRTQPLEIGDVDGDGDVDGEDFAVVLTLQGTDVEDNAYLLAADVNNDDVIDQLDLDFFDVSFDTSVDSCLLYTSPSPRDS